MKDTPSPKSGDDILDLTLDTIRFFKKRKSLILSLVAAGLIGGLLYIWVQPSKYWPYYTKDFIVQSTVINEEILKDIVHDIETDGTRRYVKLGVTKEMENSFRKLALTERESKSESDVMTAKMTLESLNEQHIDSLTKSILTYITKYIYTNEHLRNKYELSIKQSQELLNILDKEITHLDSLKQNLKSNLGTKLNGELAISGIYVNSIVLVEKKQYVEKNLKLLKPIQYIELNRPVVAERNIKSPLLLLFNIFLVMVVSGVLIGLALDLNKKVKETLKLHHGEADQQQ